MTVPVETRVKADLWLAEQIAPSLSSSDIRSERASLPPSGGFHSCDALLRFLGCFRSKRPDQ
ncbi:hypothetical protein U2P60_14820 [Brucella sp. H1_1004]|uniref:hypothetical protein n=1 Tax=Brucella sp. H1_1004 TaxID=3110109 RepID=UPI0039B51B66